MQQLCHVLSDFRLTVTQVGKHVRKCFPDAAFKSGRGSRESSYRGISCSPAFPAFQPYVQPTTSSVPQSPWLVRVPPSQCQPTFLHSSQPAVFSHSSMLQPAHLHSSQDFARCKCRMEGGDAMLKSVDIVPPKRARLSDHISEGDRNPPTTGVVGFSMETTLALLPRMHMEELQSELNRRNIVVKLAGEHQRGRGDLEHVLREVMTREYEVEEDEGMDTNAGNTSSTFEHGASNTSSASQLMIRDNEAEEGKGMDMSNNSSAFEHCNSDTSSAFEHGSWLKENLIVKIKTEPGLEEETEDEQLQDLRSELCPSSPGQLSQELDKVDVSLEGGDEPSSKEPLKTTMGYKLAMFLGLSVLLMVLMVDQADSACCNKSRKCHGWTVAEENAIAGRGLEDDDVDNDISQLAEEARSLLELLQQEKDEYAMHRRVFGEHDVDKDTKLSQEEALKMLKKIGTDVSQLPADWFTSLDTNGNGFIDPEEYDKDMAKTLG
uniref:EF-hand domain-containing protein n=1 Tax=Branchiostoma floridae TaxID=7739 RepID=C3YUG8_BRAFL|eukprot:XP_002600076.1 hypothetical protein BRAFLDRAFT_79666 [Branchiostoma floridae]